MKRIAIDYLDYDGPALEYLKTTYGDDAWEFNFFVLHKWKCRCMENNKGVSDM